MNNTLDNTYKMALRLNGLQGQIEGKDSTFLVKEIEDGYKTLISQTPFNQGSLITIDSKTFMVTTFKDRLGLTPYYKGIMKSVYPCKVNDKTYYTIPKMETNRVVFDTMISYAVDEYSFVFPSTTIIRVDNIIWFKDSNYKVTAIDRTKSGIITVYARFEEYKPVIKYGITLIQSGTSIKEGETYQITSICTKDGIEVTSPTITYTVADSLIANISIDGLIAALKEGTTIITCTYEGVSVDFTLVVSKVEIVKKEFVIKGAANIKLNATQTFTVEHKDSTPIGNRSFEWASDYPEGAEIVSSTNTSCIVKGLIKDEMAILSATDKADKTQVATLNIYVER